MTRISWDEYFGNIVTEVSKRSTCIRHQFGAVIVNVHHQIISTGYNGLIQGAPHCTSKCCGTCKHEFTGKMAGFNDKEDCSDIKYRHLCFTDSDYDSEEAGNMKSHIGLFLWEPKNKNIYVCVKDELGIESGKGHSICPAVHAEQNALLQSGKESKGATLYINGYPCKICARLIVNAGIVKVVCSGDYSDKEGIGVLKSAGAEVILNDG